MNILLEQNTDFASGKLLTNRVALVTGASRGIGAAIAKLLASHGAAVGVNYYGNQAAAQSVVDAIAQMTPLRRIGVPEDIAGAVLLLASEQARFITGAYLPVNGGIFMP